MRKVRGVIRTNFMPSELVRVTGRTGAAFTGVGSTTAATAAASVTAFSRSSRGAPRVPRQRGKAAQPRNGPRLPTRNFIGPPQSGHVALTSVSAAAGATAPVTDPADGPAVTGAVAGAGTAGGV